MRTAQINRKTNETDIKIQLDLDGSGKSVIDSGCGFLDHMLTLFSKHSRIDLTVSCKGDTYVDYHHTTEDIGIALGEAIKTALGDKKGIKRYGDIILPMDETLILCAIDLSGRAYLACDFNINASKVGDFDTELLEEFLRAFTTNLACNLHVRQLAGSNAHHILEGTFKALARCVKEAVEVDERLNGEIPSTKGAL
jgi:imidazoleglycerol-phosphate dehydratase